jgi:hypothetical protein
MTDPEEHGGRGVSTSSLGMDRSFARYQPQPVLNPQLEQV